MNIFKPIRQSINVFISKYTDTYTVDAISKKIVKTVESAEEPLETKEIEERVKETRIKVLYRLNLLRAEGMVRGKQMGAGKGTWIWWKAK